MKFLKYLLFLLLIAFIGMAIYVAVQPNDFEVRQTTTIDAPKAVVFQTISDISDTTDVDWSSFWKTTETLQKTASFPNDSIRQFFTSGRIKTSELKWDFEPTPDGLTKVTRTLDANHLSFITKAKFALFGDDKDAISTQFESDLNDLDKKVTASMAVYNIHVNGITEYGGSFYLYKSISSNASNKKATMAKQYAEINAFMDAHNVTASGMPTTIYIDMNLENGNVIMSNAIPVSERVLVAEDSNILSGYMERTRAVKVTLRGNYTNQKEAWSTARKYIRDNNLEPSDMSPFEIYQNDPAKIANPAHWITEIYIPIMEKTEEL